MVMLTRLDASHCEQLAQLRVADEQIKFVGNIEEILTNVNHYVQPHVVLDGGQVVGFFLIDTAFHPVSACSSNQGVGLRAFFIDHCQQGQGLGQAAMALLPSYFRTQYVDCRRIYLTVNCLNLSAYHCYLKSGFVDSQELYLGGSAGPQHVMYRQL